MTMYKIRLSTLAVFIIVAIRLCSQSNVQWSQYFEVPSYYNPGAIGTSDMLRLRGASRLQWVGVDNAPRSFMAIAEMPVKIGTKRIGIGGIFRQESFGLFNDMDIALQGGYNLKLSAGILTLGLQIGILENRFRGSDIVLPGDDDYHHGSDNALPTRDVSGTTFDMAFGAYYVRKSFWGGISYGHINSPVVTYSSDISGTNGETGNSYEFKYEPTLYFVAGYNIQIKNTLFEVIPSMMVMSDFIFTKFELTGRIRYKKVFTVGLGYRNEDAVIGYLGGEYKGVSIGISYDYPTSDIAKVSNGSYEIMVGYSQKFDFSEKNKNRQKSIRIM